MMVSEPPSSMFRAEPKNFFGLCRALASTPPDRILPDCGATVLCARANRVSESSRITTSLPLSTRRFAFSSTMSATWTWRAAPSSKVELTTSARMVLAIISVTSSGRSSISNTMIVTSGWFSAMALAILCSRIVFPARGGETISPRWPLPIGVMMSTTRMLRSPSFDSSRNRVSGYCGRRLSNGIRSLAFSGSSPLTLSTLSSARYRSHGLGGRTCPRTSSPVLSPNRFICDGET